MGAQITDEQLSAFVDGELAPQDAARVTLAITSDRLIAQRLARLQQMKIAVAGFADIAPAPDIALPKSIARPARHPFWRIAVGLAGAAAAFAILGLSLPSLHRSAPENSINIAESGSVVMALHDQWIAQPPPAARIELPDDYFWLVPVMQASDLQPVYLAQAEEGLHLGFKGPNSCRISLFVRATDGVDGGLKLEIGERVMQAQWQTGLLAFELIARDMAPARFATVATGLHQNSRIHASDPAMQLALSQAASLPCTA